MADEIIEVSLPTGVDEEGVKQRTDGTYEVTYNSMPYHVVTDDDMFAEVEAWAIENPDSVEGDYVAVVGTMPTDAEQIRTERDIRLSAVDWRYVRYASEVRQGFETTSDDIIALDTYTQALRDIPKQDGFPWTGPDDEDCPWPTLGETT